MIDHAWGYEPCTIADIKVYKPEAKSIGSGQVLSSAYSSEKAKVVVLEMAEQIAFDLFEQKLVSKQFVLTIGYDRDNLQGQKYSGEVATDRYGRKIPKHAHGTINLDTPTSSLKEITTAVSSLYDRIIDKKLLIRRLTLTFPFVSFLFLSVVVKINSCWVWNLALQTYSQCTCSGKNHIFCRVAVF